MNTTLTHVQSLVADWLSAAAHLGHATFSESDHPELREYQREICSELRRAGVRFYIYELHGRLVLEILSGIAGPRR